MKTVSLFIFLVTTTLYADLQTTLEQARKLKLAQKKFWHILLHYAESPDGIISEADGNNFFIAPDGKYDPEKELVASLKEIYRADLPAKKSFQCRFPARYRWLREQLDFKGTDKNCPDFKRWHGEINASGITLIFSSAYLNNPASMYGHTFLRLDQKIGGKTIPLLSYIVNYAANPDSNNPFVYTYKGLTGGFKGVFSTIPYYLKVKEYAAMEMRDLWEYELNIPKDRVEWVLLHLWELGKTHFDYYYVRENCAYHILSLLEVAKPELNFRRVFQGYTAPGDTLRYLLKQSNLINKIIFRPSVRRELEGYYDLLTGRERDLIALLWRDFKKGQKRLEQYPLKRQGLILDTYQRYYRFMKGYALTEAREQKLHQQEALFQGMRSEITVAVPSPEIQKPAPPHRGHHSSMSATGILYHSHHQNEIQIPLIFRPVLHDLTGDDEGYNRGAAIEMVQFRSTILIERREMKWLFDGFDLIKIESIAPYHPWINTLSWSFTTGLYPVDQFTPKPNERWGDLYYTLGGGPGFALGFCKQSLWYLLGDLHLDGGPFEHYYRVRITGRTGFHLKPFTWWGFGGEYRYELPLFGVDRVFDQHTLSLYNRFSINETLDLLLQYRHYFYHSSDHSVQLLFRRYF